jgi:hypothetical protein
MNLSEEYNGCLEELKEDKLIYEQRIADYH